MLIDTHAHINFNDYKDDFDEVIQRSLANDVWMFNVGSQYTTSKRAIEIAEKYEKGVYAAIGLHPIHLETGLVKIKIDPEEIQFKTQEEKFDYNKYKELALSTKVKAIGEIGLDYYWKPKTKTRVQQFKEKQKQVLIQQMKLAEELNLPIIFHCRFAHSDLLEVLYSRFQIQDSKARGVIHCFTGTWEEAKQYMEVGLYLGFNGLIFKMNLWNETIEKMPLDKILIETDCPYLTPPQIKGRNEPLYLKHIATKIAKIKKTNYTKISECTTTNARKLFAE
ncbi:MAG: TatD family hydrolase [Candidatus Nealsonbacteria bacterium]|nr:TatD family hydrolase [Candidatus Nealsonbacteria bacterium]